MLLKLIQRKHLIKNPIFDSTYHLSRREVLHTLRGAKNLSKVSTIEKTHIIDSLCQNSISSSLITEKLSIISEYQKQKEFKILWVMIIMDSMFPIIPCAGRSPNHHVGSFPYHQIQELAIYPSKLLKEITNVC